MKVKRRNEDRGRNKRCYFNSFDGVGDYFRGLKFVSRDINDLENLEVIDQVSLVIFYILSRRSLENVNKYLNTILKGISRINTHELRYQFDTYLDDNRKSIMITYLNQAIKSVMNWNELTDDEYYTLSDFLKDVGTRIL